jgi:hypothetical protein
VASSVAEESVLDEAVHVPELQTNPALHVVPSQQGSPEPPQLVVPSWPPPPPPGGGLVALEPPPQLAASKGARTNPTIAVSGRFMDPKNGKSSEHNTFADRWQAAAVRRPAFRDHRRADAIYIQRRPQAVDDGSTSSLPPGLCGHLSAGSSVSSR